MEETIKLLEEGKTLEEIAQIRGRQLSSVASLVADLGECGDVEFEPGRIHADHRQKIEEACERLGTERFRPIKEALPEEVTYDEIKLVVAYLRKQKSKRKKAE
jgi:ATP-dependent DNA helicase RecQ